jgi:hypothetical protein
VTDDYAFLPDPARGKALDQISHAMLADSLSHISQACRDSLVAGDIAEALDPVVVRLRQSVRLGPTAFGLYFELAEQLLKDNLPAARTAARLLAEAPARPPFSVLRRGSAGLFDSVFDLRMGADAARFHVVDPRAADAFATTLSDALALLEAGAPALAGELRAILSTIVLAQAPPGAATEFDGASHYQFWGLVLLNPKHHPTPLAVAEALAHEAGHGFLFGLTRTEPLVRNPDDVLFPSPLRADPRPMDGIFHATFVSARMAWTMETLADSGLLSPAEAALARAEAAKDRANFWAGEAVIAAHGELTPTGAAILASATQAVRDGWT